MIIESEIWYDILLLVDEIIKPLLNLIKSWKTILKRQTRSETWN